MARLIWTEPALHDLDAIAEYIALDNATAASRLVAETFTRVERLGRFPRSGKRLAELPRTPYRELVVPPCRIVYRHERDCVYILHVMRAERLLRRFLLEQRERDK
jgi:toxin ParE1/3/4